MRKIVLVTLALSALLSACSTAPTHPSLRAAAVAQALPPLVPVRAYVADWDGNGDYQISPDGQQLMWTARKGVRPGLFVKNLRTGAVRSFAIPYSGRWAEDSRHILFNVAFGGTEITHVLQLDTFSDDGQLKDLTPFGATLSFIHSLLPGSDDFLISSNRRDAKVFDLYRHVRATGELELVAQNSGDVGGWLTDRQGKLKVRQRKDGERWVYEAPTDARLTRWRAIFDYGLLETVTPLDTWIDGKFLWALSNRGRDKAALVKIDLESGAEQLLSEDRRVDLSHVHTSPATLEPLGASLDPDFQSWTFFNPRFEAAILKLKGGARARVDVTSVSRDENIVIATLVREEGGQHVLYDAGQERITILGELSRSRIHAISPLPRQRPVAFQSRDGLSLHGYLTLPAGGGEHLPTVLYVHGGPWGRDVAFDGDTMPLFLANRGYAVLQVNFRGSTGYGRAFEEAARHEFAGKMHQDLLDGVDDLIRQGIADPDKVAIMGASYGGYASLVGMTITPDRFACGISAAGVSDLAGLIENAPPYWELSKEGWLKYVGDPGVPAERAAMNAKSPLYFADRVRGPVLIFHGDNDQRVRLDQSTRMVEALRKAGKEVDFHVFKNTGHGIGTWPDRLSYYREIEDFLASCLGGRSGGFDYYQLGRVLF